MNAVLMYLIFSSSPPANTSLYVFYWNHSFILQTIYLIQFNFPPDEDFATISAA